MSREFDNRRQEIGPGDTEAGSHRLREEAHDLSRHSHNHRREHIHKEEKPLKPVVCESADKSTIKFGSITRATVDTDGSGAKHHKEDSHRRSTTALKFNGKYLDTDQDSYIALPKSVMKEFKIPLGSAGILRCKETGKEVQVILGDTSAKKYWNHGQIEASVAALKQLDFKNISGKNGPEGVNFELEMLPQEQVVVSKPKNSKPKKV